MLRGVDVSAWNGDVDWPRVAAAGVAFAIFKATEGNWIVDRRATAGRVEAMRGAFGVRFSAYHFARPQPGSEAELARDACAEVRLFLVATRRAGLLEVPHLPLVLDLERGTYGEELARDPRSVAHFARVFLEELGARTGRAPMLYTSPGFWARLGTFGHEGHFAAYPLWLAAWGARQPRAPVPWARWRFHQDTNRARFPGITGPVDGDVFDGSREELEALAA